MTTLQVSSHDSLQNILQQIDNECYEHIKKNLPIYADTDKYHEEITNTDNSIKLKTLKSPIYYLFDGFLNEYIGSDYVKRDLIIKKYNINNHFKFITKIDSNDTINNSTNPTHATLFYHLKHNDKYYLIYSNSGLGINNHININGCVMPNIYQIVGDNYSIFDINYIIDHIY